MNPLDLIPTTLNGIAGLCMVTGILLILILNRTKPALILGVIAGFGLGGWLGRGIDNMYNHGAVATAHLTARMVGAPILLALPIGLVMLLWKHVGRGGGGGGIGGGGALGRMGGKHGAKIKAFGFLIVAVMVGGLLGAIPELHDGVQSAVASIVDIVR